jgi:hypothetical protein
VADVSAIERAVVRQWQESSGELEAIRHRELRELSDADALAAADALLGLAAHVQPDAAMTGLVEQQRLFKLALM